MSVFGVTYVHSGGWLDPVVELLGRQTPESVFEHSEGMFFSIESDAVRYVRTLARRHADDCLAERSQFLSRKADMTRLAAARNFPALRTRYSMLLAEDEILKRKEASAVRLLKNGFTPKISRIPASLRFPRVLQMGADIHVVDYRNFLRNPVRIRTEKIVERIIVPASKGGIFDAVVRYSVSNMKGLAGYDTTDPSVAKLSRYATGIELFISRRKAEEFIGQLVERIERSLEPMREEAGLLLAAPARSDGKEVPLRLVAASEDVLRVPTQQKLGNGL
jgi:hypothetical protein